MNRISLFFEIRRLQKEKSKIVDKVKKHSKKGLMAPDTETDYWQDTISISEKIQILNERYLIKKAENLFIPIPERKPPSWERSASFMNNWQLSPKGITDLKEAIRKERIYLLSWVAAITGLLGAATGLIAIIKII